VFIVPFMFFYSPLLLGQGTFLQVAPVFATAVIGVMLLACATEGWAGRAIGWPLRAPLLVGAMFLIVPETISDVIGIGIAVAVFTVARLMPHVAPGRAHA
jgi:TRAP-type uncharacterized transport system fused permease subunit